MQEKPKNRDWVKNAAIIFLAVLLVLTFFSNTIMNRSLPEVATQEVTNGSIVARVRGTGTVTANSNTQVKMEKTRVIRSVLVKVGQQVEAGDVLFTLGEGSSEEIEAAETALRNLQASYNRTAASMPYHNYTTEERKLKLLEEQLKEAKENLDIAEEAAKAATPYAKQLEDIEKELNNAIIARDAAKEEYDKARGTGESVVAISIEEFVNYDRKIDGKFDMTFVLLGNHLNDNLSVQELNNFQAAILRILALESKIDGDLLTGDYTDRGRIDIQIDRVQSLIDGESYTVKFYNEDGTLLQKSEESYGAVPYYKYGEPTKNDDDQYTYTFSGWNPTIKEVEEDIEYVAVFQSHLKQTEAEESPEPSSTPDQTVIINTENVNINVTTPSPSPSPDSSPDASSSLEASSSPSAQLSSSLNLSMSPSQSTELTNDNAENAEYVETPSVPASDNSAGAELQASSVTTSISRDTDETNIEASNTEENADKTETEIKSPVTGEKSRAELLEWKEQLKAALALYDKAESKKYLKEQIVEQKRVAYEAAVAEAEKWSLALQTYLDSGSAESAVYKSKLAAYKTAEDAYLTAKENLEEQKIYDQRSDTGTYIDLSNTQADIEAAKKKLADLTGGEEAQILARVSGTIQTIDCSPGDTKKKDDILCTIEAPDMGYSLSFSVTNDQAARLRIGDTATVSNFYWGTEITATLNSIKIDPKNPQSNKLLTFDLSGNVTAGSELTLSVGQKSANYDIIIPSSSIRTDANGSFVLKVEAKNSPLGNRYTARRIPVEILASDDSNSAVSADLGFGDYVITTSSAPIKNGELVRLATA